jgi:hypothetical protein
MSELRVTTLKHESATVDNITLDANGNVGIGTNSPATKVDFGVTSNASQIINLRKNGNSVAGIGVNAEYGVRIAGPSDAAAPVSFGEISVSDGTSFLERMRIDSAGRVTMPFQPAFLAQAQNADITFSSPTTIPWPQIQFNRGGHYSSATNRFTAPVAGAYFFSFTVNGITSAADRTYILINGATINGIQTRGSASLPDYHYTTMAIVVNLNVGDYVEVAVLSGAVNTFLANHFSGYLIG